MVCLWIKLVNGLQEMTACGNGVWRGRSRERHVLEDSNWILQFYFEYLCEGRLFLGIGGYT